MNKIIDDLSLDDLKNIIREEGGYVSCVDMKGPTTMLFLIVQTPVFDTDLKQLPIPVYERYAVEALAFNLSTSGIEEFRKFVRNVIKSDLTKPPIFCPYCIVRNNNNDVIFRFSYLNSYYSVQREVTIEEAKKLVENPPDHVSKAYFIHDIKTVYGL